MDYTIRELAQISATQHPGADEKAIKETEKALGAAFPQDYRDLIGLVNAPQFFDWDFFPIKDERHPEETATDIVEHNKGKLRPRFLAADYIAFAESAGDYLCFKMVNGKMEDAVYLQSEDLEFPEPAAPDIKIALIEIMSYAEDEEELELLHDEEDDEDDHD